MTCSSIYGPIPGCATPITIATQGATGSSGTAGADGTSLLYNNRTEVYCSANTALQTLMTYTVDNTPTEVLTSAGDSLYIEAMFNVSAGVSGDLILEWGTSNTVVEYTINAPLLVDTDFLLKAFVSRFTGTTSQSVETSVTICGQPDSVWTKPVKTDSQDTSADVIINARTQKDAIGVLGDVTCNYLKVIKYDI